jgi:hypothetical protein
MTSRANRAPGTARRGRGRARRSAGAARAGDSIGAPYDTLLQAAALVKAGLPFGAIGRFQRASGLTLERIKGAAGISEGSFARRKRAGRLSTQEFRALAAPQPVI